jgi:hypothetical protein
MRIISVVPPSRKSALKQNGTYFGVLAGRGVLLGGLFAVVFYFLSFLHAKHQITVGEGSSVLAVYWTASALYLAKAIYESFAQFYRAWLRRMRLYSATRLFFQLYLGVFVVMLPILIALLYRYEIAFENSFENYSIKPLIAAYGLSLFSMVFICGIIANIVAKLRGTRYSKA